MSRLSYLRAHVIVMGVTMAVNAAWVLAAFQSLNLYASSEKSELALDGIYLVSIVALCLTFALMAFFEAPAGRLVNRSGTMALAAAFMSASTLLMPFGTLPAPTGDITIVLAGTLSGVSSALLLACQGMLLCRFDMSQIVTSVALGQIGSIAVFAAFALTPAGVASLYAAALPPVVAGGLYFVRRRCMADTLEASLAPTEAQELLGDEDERARANRLVWKLSACFILVNFAHELCRTLYIQMDIVDSGMSSYALLQAGTGAVATIGAILLTLGMMNRSTIDMPRLCRWFLLLFLAGSALMLPLPLVYEHIGTRISYTLNQASNSCFSLFMWIMIVALCQQFFQRRLRIFAILRLSWALGPLAGLLAGRYVVGYLGLSVSTVYPCMMTAVFAIIVAMVCVFNERVLMEVMDIVPLERYERFRGRCRAVIERYGLSEREGEIMMLFAKGRDLAYIRDALCISKSTVSTHRQHIYKKLDIHSQQELIDLVQETNPLPQANSKH